MAYPLPIFRRPFATAHKNSAPDASPLAVKPRGISGHSIIAGNSGNGEGKRRGESAIRRRASAALKRIFKHQPTASEIGKLGNMVRRDRERAAFKSTTDDLRERLGLSKWEWAE